MKKYYFKGTNQEVKLGDKITQIITCSNGERFKCNGTVDEPTIKDLLNRDSIEVKEVVPVQKSIHRKHIKKNSMPKECIKVINLDNKEELNEFLNILTGIISGKY